MFSFLSNVLSYTFHPLWIPLISFLLLTGIDNSLVYQIDAKNSLTVLLIINIIIPAISILYLIKKGVLSDPEIRNRKERIIPYVLIIFYFSIFYVIASKLNPLVSSLLYAMFLGIIVTLVLAMIINFYWKISVHMLGIGGLSGSLFALNQIHQIDQAFAYLMLSILVAGWLGFARVQLHAHTTKQVYWGYALGFAIQFLFINYNLYIPLF